MAGGNGRGPNGMGPMTGRGLGFCAGNDRPGFQADAEPARRGFQYGGQYGFGRGRGFRNGGGRGFGRGFGYGFGAHYRGSVFAAEEGPTGSLTDEIVQLKNQLRALEERLAAKNQED